jgi:iron complex outermembrane recepter protein
MLPILFSRHTSLSARTTFCLLAICFLAKTASAQQALEETVVVTAAAYPVPFNNVSRTVTVLTEDDLRSMPVRSITDVLETLSSVDVRSRAPEGLQADFSIRGSGYSQVLMLVDGMRMNDSQTAHHNADLPVPIESIERIEVLSGPGSALYGADALGGIINIITRKTVDRFHASGSIGQFGLVEGSFLAGAHRGEKSGTFSAFGNRSSGFMSDRDFRTAGFNARADFGTRSGVRVAYVDKEFGANGFYGPSPSREWTNQFLVSYENRLTILKSWQMSIQTSYRTHGDHFLYDQAKPELYSNRHRTHAYNLTAKLQRAISDKIALSFGGETGGDWISSTNLGDHSYGKGSLFAELQFKKGQTLTLYPGIRYDYYSTFGATASPSLSGSWWLSKRVKIRASAGRAFRIPTFTELYYRDPNNQASSLLRPEHAWGYELGSEFFPGKGWMAGVTLFTRREREVIDWIRYLPTEKWTTANIRKFTMSGGEFGLQRSFDSRRYLLDLQYSYLAGDPGSINFQSKYVLNYARHSGKARISASLWKSFRVSQDLSYRHYADGRGFWLSDAALSRKFGELTFSLECSNILNTQYQEVIGVDMPGRWLAVRVKWDP